MGPGQGSSHANAPEKSESEMRSHIEGLVEKAISTRVPTRRADTNSTMAEGHDVDKPKDLEELIEKSS
eukprot:7753227-Karenia_brevis.AAC.1